MTNRATQVAKQTIILHAARAAVDAVGTVPPRPKGAEIFGVSGLLYCVLQPTWLLFSAQNRG